MLSTGRFALDVLLYLNVSTSLTDHETNEKANVVTENI